MDPHRPRVGAHLPLAAGMVRAVDRAHEIGADALQIFADNPTAWRRRSGPPAEQAAFRTRLRERDIGPVAIHASYLVNLAGPADDLFERSVALLESELRVAPSFGAAFVNVHTGSHRDTSIEDGIRRIAEGAARVLAAVDAGAGAATLVLENAAGSGWAVGSTIDELARIADALAARGVAADRIGFCLDTSHLWGAGRPISDPDEVERVVEEFDKSIGLSRLRLIHLNDSKAALGSRLDRHEHLGAGQIGPVGLGHLVRHRRLGHVVFLLETPGMDEGYDAINVGRARDLLAGRPLHDLPPGALPVAGSRSRRTATPA
ncbi:MAG: deoxyribonuclease IV [Chloroflexota bacterium]